MQFSEMIFVGAFLPLFLFFSFISKSIRGKNLVFLFFSIVFLLFQGLLSLGVLLLLSLFSFYAAKRLKTEKKYFFPFSIVLLLLPLLFFKYSVFFRFLPQWIRGLMPFGISFYSFRLISYLADCKEGMEPEENFFHFAIYAFAFPVISQGPILRYKEMRGEIVSRESNFTNLSQGLFRFSFGLWKKMILADELGKLSTSFLPMERLTGLAVQGSNAPSFLAVFFSSLAFMLQIYLDFSAYTDMAVGIGEMVGFSIPENFHYPYEAKSIRDFWRRWHISLSCFFRDYIYIPLGGNRLSFGRRVINLLVIWILTGMWHGATANFILWGLYYFMIIVMELLMKHIIHRFPIHLPARKKDEANINEPALHEKEIEKKCKWNIFNPAYGKTVVLHIYTLVVVFISWIFFRYSNFAVLKNVLKSLFLLSGNAFSDGRSLILFRNHIFLFLLAVLFSTSLFQKLDAFCEDLMLRGRIRKEKKGKREEEGFYGMEEEADMEEIKGRGAIDVGTIDIGTIVEDTIDEDAIDEDARRKFGVETEEDIKEDIEEAMQEESGLSEEELKRHSIALKKIQRKTKWTIFFLDHGEKMYYFLKILLALLALCISFAAMAGQSYTPFLYNQF